MSWTVLRGLCSGRNKGRSQPSFPALPVEALEGRLFLSATTTLAIPSQNVAVGQSFKFNLNEFFSNPGVDDNTVFINTTLGTVPVELTPAATPLTVANFLSYADSGAYNGSFIHRLVPGFVWQGGGYTYDANASSPVQAITANAPVASEYSPTRPNVTGTIAMALTDGSSGATDPNSGTDQFFFNLADNSSNLDAQGFTVFGSVVGAQGLAVMNSIGTQQTVDEGSPFDQLPVINYSGSGTPDGSNLIFINSVAHNYTINNTDPAVATVAASNQTLTCTALTPGSTSITLTAEGLDGTAVNQTFTIDVGQTLNATIGKGGQKSVRYDDGNGGIDTVSLTGPGTATLEFEADSTINPGKGTVAYSGANLHLAEVTLTGTSGATTLHVVPDNDGIVPISSITSSGALGGISASRVSLTGAVSVGGALHSLILLATNPGSSVTASSLASAQIYGNSAGDMTISGAISNLGVSATLAGTITAGSIKTLRAMTVQDADITLTGAGTSLNVLRANYAASSTIVAAGNINSISLPGGTASTDIFAGISAATLDGSASLAAAAMTAAAAKGSINSLTIGRGSTVNDFADSAVAAGTLKHVSTGDLDDTTASAAGFYGFASTRIISFRGYVSGKPLTLANVATAAELQAQLKKKGLTLTNLTIDIV